MSCLSTDRNARKGSKREQNKNLVTHSEATKQTYNPWPVLIRTTSAAPTDASKSSSRTSPLRATEQRLLEETDKGSRSLLLSISIHHDRLFPSSFFFFSFFLWTIGLFHITTAISIGRGTSRGFGRKISSHFPRFIFFSPTQLPTPKMWREACITPRSP